MLRRNIKYGTTFNRFIILLLLTLIFTYRIEAQNNSFRFVFMTDIHVQPERRADEGFSAAISKVNELKPDFVITGGDLIMDALGQNEERAVMLYDMYENICKQFKMPVYNTIGNHEVFGLYENSGIEPGHPEYGKTMFRNRLGEGRTYGSFDFDDWHFMLLDGIGFAEDRRYFGEIDSTQIEWIKEDLGAIDRDKPIVISTHIPFVSITGQIFKGSTSALSKGEVVTNSKEVLSLFDGYNLKLVLQGHLHYVEEIIFKDVHFITGGAVSAEWWKGPREGFPEGFVVIDVEGEDFSWRYETFGWKAE